MGKRWPMKRCGFYYFLPSSDQSLVNEKKGVLELERIEAKFGLDYVFRESLTVPDQTIWYYGEGPGGSPGVLLYPRPCREEEFPKCAYDAQTQEWARHRNFFIGLEKHQACPGPADLERLYVYGGMEVKDAFDRSWKVPTIRSRDISRYSLPTAYGFDQDGKYTAKRRASDEQLWEVAGRLMDYTQQTIEMDDETIALSILQVLAANYRIGTAEIMMMERYDVNPLVTTFVAGIIGIATDWQQVRDFEKKTDQPD